MICCLVATLILAVAHRLLPWRWRAGGPEFAPVAYRPAPGMHVPAPATAISAPGHPRFAWTLRAAAATGLVYFAATAILLRTDLAHSAASPSRWAVRTVAVVALVAVCLVLSHRVLPRPHALPRSTKLACIAVGSGLLLTEALEFDMHVLHVYAVSNPLLNTALHVAGIAAIVAGAPTLLPKVSTAQ